MRQLKDTEWNACEPGSLVTAKKANESTKLARWLARVSLASTLVVGCILFAFVSSGIESLPYKSGLTCDQTREWAQAYQSESGLDSHQRDQVKRHLADCPLCRAHLASLKNHTAHFDRNYFLESICENVQTLFGSVRLNTDLHGSRQPF